MHQQLISVVVPARNAADTIADCVKALKQQYCNGFEHELIVIDDASTDDTAKLALDAGARVLVQSRHLGASAARNRGIKAAQGEIVCFTDADCVPSEDWLSQLILPFADPDVVGCKGKYASAQTALTARFVQIEYEDRYDRLKKQSRIDFIDTYSAAFRRQILVANGGFDERIHYVEDRELAYRLASRGYRMVFQPTAVIMHRHSDSLHKYFRKKLYIGYYLAQAIRRYPGQGFKDSHTPQVLKFQILLLALFLTTISTSVPLIGQFPNWRFYLSVGVAWLFLVTTIPFTLKALRKDRLVGLSSPCFLLVRALALGVGYTWGTIRPLPGISGEEDSIGGLTYVSKRAFDLLFGVLGLLLLGLVGPFIVLLIKVASAGPVFVSYERVGQGGRVFVAHRIRTGEVTCQPSRWFDAFLLRWRLDQLPLAWNLVKGDISLVGPGAETPVAVAQYEDWHRRRLSVKPGMTGPVQLRRDPQRISLDERTRLELSYIQEHSLGGDLRILIAAAKEIARNATGPTDDGIGC